MGIIGIKITFMTPRNFFFGGVFFPLETSVLYTVAEKENKRIKIRKEMIINKTKDITVLKFKM